MLVVVVWLQVLLKVRPTKLCRKCKERPARRGGHSNCWVLDGLDVSSRGWVLARTLPPWTLLPLPFTTRRPHLHQMQGRQ